MEPKATWIINLRYPSVSKTSLLGKGLRRNNDDNDNIEHTTKNVPLLKTSSSKRTIPIQDILMEAILDERKKFEKRRSRDSMAENTIIDVNGYFDGEE